MVARGAIPVYCDYMVNVDTFLVICSCAFSLVAIIIAARASRDVQTRRDLPEKLSEEVAAYVAIVRNLDIDLVSHVKKHASEKGAIARANNSGGNGSSSIKNADGTFDFAALDRRLNLEGE